MPLGLRMGGWQSEVSLESCGRSRSISHFARKSKFKITGRCSRTVTTLSTVPSFSCQALKVYVPGGNSGSSYVPSRLVTEKYGCSKTTTQADIQV